eukprot:SAG31_NODE_14273_length_817_cov_1.168524_1_plen_272_part_11
MCGTVLDESWWAMDAEVASDCFVHEFMRAACAMDRVQALRGKTEQQRLRAAHLNVDIYRRGAALATSFEIVGWDAATEIEEEDSDDADGAEDSTQQLRQHILAHYAGVVFKPTQEHILSLPSFSELNDRDVQDWWSIGCQLRRAQQEVMISICEGSTTGSPHAGEMIFMVIHTRGPAVSGEDELDRLRPTVEEVLGALFMAFAGNGSEYRTVLGGGGPPRRPSTICVSYRLRSVFEQVSQALEPVRVPTVLESEAGQRRACAVNHTDFETGD